MRVAIFGESYLPHLSGVTVSTETLARGLGAMGHQVLLVVPRPESGSDPGTAGAPGPDPEIAWLPSYHLPPAPPGYRMPLPLPSAALRRAVAFAPDVVHANSPFSSGIMARGVARRAGAPLVFTHHTRFADYGHYLGPLAGVSGRVTDAWLEAWWAGCAAVVAPSDDLAAEIRAALRSRRRPLLRVIPTGVDVAGIAALAEGHPRRLAGWPHDSIVLVSLGRVAREKSPDVLVDAFVRAARRRPRLRLLFVGGGPAEDAVRGHAAVAGVSGRVHVTGPLPRDEALALVKASDLFVFASQTETQGLVLAEALAAGLPVVAVAGPGVASTVRPGMDGELVPAEPAATLAERLGVVAGGLAGDRRRRERMAAQARQGAARFDARVRVAEVAGLYGELLAGRQ
ncbi:MAG TPA: glycosyltransferase [Pleomorphomonadaceae bacterium]|nr:glycosyltransferase [Pleomorphomonadaceae bacterium]